MKTLFKSISASLLFIFLTLFAPFQSIAKSKQGQSPTPKRTAKPLLIKENIESFKSQNSFVSAVDQGLTIKKIVIAPVSDNVNGIYSKPLEEELTKIVNEDLQWSLVDFPINLKTDFSLLDENPNEAKRILKESFADAVLVARLTKGPRGINGSLTLYQGNEGLPLAQENLIDFKGFNIIDTNAEFKKLFQQLKNKIPYKALIMSRRGQEVTLNLGSSYGLAPKMNVSIVQIIKINRHPKLNFMVSNEKEVLGRVQLEKVESNLSFGSIVYEREPGIISVGAKVLPEEFVKYSTPTVTPDGKILQDLNQRKDKDLAFGESPGEWLPEAPPQFGKVYVLAGFASYEQSSTINNSGTVGGSNTLTPNILVGGEIWINPTWFVGINLRQSVFTIPNNLDSSTPGNLNMSMSQYGVNGGYNFLLSNDFFGPKIQMTAGFANSKFTVDSSTPLTFTTMEYGGLLLGLAGQFPISPEIPLDLGASFKLWFNPSLSEGSSSGSSTNSINSFGFFVDYRLKQRLKLKTELDFEYYNSSLSGNGSRSPSATSTSHRLTTLLFGLEYLF